MDARLPDERKSAEISALIASWIHRAGDAHLQNPRRFYRRSPRLAFVRLRHWIGSPRHAIRRESRWPQNVDLVRNFSDNITPRRRTIAPGDARHVCRAGFFGLPLFFRSMLAPAQCA